MNFISNGHKSKDRFKDNWRRYRDLGLIVYPASPKGKNPIPNWKTGAVPVGDPYEEWEQRYPSSNIWLYLGPGVVVLDPDGPGAEDFIQSLNLPPCPTSISGNKSTHRWFKISSPIKPLRVQNGDGTFLEVRTGSMGMLVPPSIHPVTGKPYKWAKGLSPWDIPFPELPNEAYERIKALQGKKIQETRMMPAQTENPGFGSLDVDKYLNHYGVNFKVKQDGQRTIYALERCLFADEHTTPSVQGDSSIIQGADGKVCYQCFHNHCQGKTWLDAKRKISGDARLFQWRHRNFPREIQAKGEPKIEIGTNLTDLGNARRFVNDHGGDLHFCYPWGKWLAWDGQRWKTDETGEATRRAKETVSLMYREAAGIPDEDHRKKLATHALKSESDSRIRAMISLAQSEPGVPILPEAMDKDPWLLNVANGTIDLRTGELRPHSRENFITKMAPIDYIEGASCPFWRDHLQKIMAGNMELIFFLQRAFGYSLSGNTDERAIFIEHGAGANGKTVTNETVAMVMGGYSLRTPTETLLQKKFEGAISNDLARLRGARFAFASEADEGRKLSEAIIKDLSGGDTISARQLYQEYREFRPECKLWLATNHKPVIRGTDNAIWDRIRLIPFTVSIPEKERIPRRDLMAQFSQEMPGILSWMVKGCLNWQGAGLGMPAEVRQATAEYRDEMDVLKNFFNESCQINKTAETTAKSLNEKYREWCNENRERPMTQTKLGKRLNEMGYRKERKMTGITWIGFGLLAE